MKRLSLFKGKFFFVAHTAVRTPLLGEYCTALWADRTPEITS